jgi:hypothetical protein
MTIGRFFLIYIYLCSCAVLLLFLVGGGISLIFYVKSGFFVFPSGQIVRAVFFGVVAGTAISLYILVIMFLEKFRNRSNK